MHSPSRVHKKLPKPRIKGMTNSTDFESYRFAMEKNPGRILFLTGAPLPSSLAWEEDGLAAPLHRGFANNTKTTILETSISSNVAPSWRSLPLEQPHLPTGLTQASTEGYSFNGYGDANETSFLNTTDLSFASIIPSVGQTRKSLAFESDSEEALSQYYEHSFAVHEGIPSSQIIGTASFDNASFATEPDESSIPFTANTEVGSREQLTHERLACGHLSNLKEMPNAAYLHSITPQTMTVNFVVGIISISQPRTITTRRGGRSVELVEILVGDDTRTGFGINIWLPSLQESSHSLPRQGDLRSGVLELRPRDIVVAKQVALSSFKGKVYGQSLRRGMTTLDLLYRNVIDNEDRRGAFRAKDLEENAVDSHQIRKVKRVKDWVMQFVGATTALPPSKRRNPSRSRQERQLQTLPNDTP